MASIHLDLDSITERANRQLDGMRVNHDTFARDVKTIADELRRWRDAHARRQAQPGPERQTFGDSFADIFNFGTKR